MGFLDAFRVSGSIATVLTGRNSGVDTARAIARLRAAGRHALPKLIPALPDDPPGDPLTNLVAELITTAALPTVVELGLMNQDPQVANRTRAALMQANKYDPNRLLELYSAAGGALVNLSEVVRARGDAITPKTLMRVLECALKDNQPTLFKLVTELATEAMVPHLIGFSRNAEWEGRYCIAQTIAKFSTEPVRDTLLRLTKDPHKLVRQVALEGLATLTIPVPSAPIASLLRDPDLMVQTRAIETMIRLNDPSSVRALLEILQDESEHSRRAAVEVLNAIGDTSAVKDLLHAMKDQDWWVRVRAADALGAIGGPKVIDAVLSLLGDEDEFMRRCAVEILNTTKDPRAAEKLIGALDDPDWWVRERALDALANMRDARAVPAVLRFLERDDEATPVAIRALAAIGDVQAAPAVAAKLGSTDEAIVREAIGALETLADASCADVALAALEQLRDRAGVPGDIAQAANRAHAAVLAKVRNRTPKFDARPSAGSAPQSERTRVIRAAVRPTNARQSEAKLAPLKVVDAPADATVAVESVDIHTIAAGQLIGGRYRVIRELGRGGFGVVILVEDQMVQEEIALKLISAHLTEDETAITRMIHEVRYARKITHENVIRIHDFVSIGKTYAMSMEYFASVPLSRRIRRGRLLPKHEALRLVRDVLRGTAVAHSAGIVHRDLKPANILINTDGLVKIVDFGLAAAMSHGHSRVTKTGHLVGTPVYMAPEQIRGQPVDQRTDLYALGVIMYELLAGLPPYAADNPMGVLYQHLEGKKAPPSEHNPEVSSELDAVVFKAMAIEPDERYQSAAEMLRDLESLMMREAA